ncbi:peptide ABC transporter substrate-binding protein [Rhodococcus hoagii]|nr:peptide ABC transporter substrate-binding protein [Prescottella equi]
MKTSWKSRRRAAIACTSVVLLLTGCGGGAAAPGGANPTGEVDPNAILRVAYSGAAKNLDPYLQDTLGGTGLLSALYDRLITVDEQGNPEPGLARSWTFAQDGSYLELALRDDVTFNDGTPFDARAVAANIERGKSLPGSVAAPVFRSVVSVTPVDDHTARLNLAPGAGVDLPSAFTTNLGMMVSPKSIAGGVDIRNDPGLSGSGAYVVKKFVPSESLQLIRSRNPYWDPQGGRLAEIDITTVPEASTRLNGIQTGAIDLTWVGSASETVQAQDLAARGLFSIEKVPFRNVLGVNLRARGDMANPSLRQALAHAIDPEAINALFSGNCQPFRQLFPASSWAYDPTLEYPYDYDPATARELVEEGGGAKVTLSFGAGANTEKPANVIQSQLMQAGFEVELNPVPAPVLEPRFMGGELDASVSNAFVPKVDPAETVNFSLTGPYGLSNGNPQIKELAAKAANPTLSQDERAPLYNQIWDLTLKEAMFVPICNLTNTTVYTSKVVGAKQIPWVNLGTFDLRHVAMTK